ncbi:DUF2145 domain-containing protein [Massilia sp. YIM B04103]|uniref:DUF2145 domain-containing protein n=1 Tax=Massilia sp. YIM B04103 TaxID=2963106 RepID=UPI002109BE30|nr:DUF2145 domain-containing protein [Massilia sp. YIM B04103]
MNFATRVAACALIAAAFAAPAQAGQSCEDRPMTPAALSEAMGTGRMLMGELNDSGSDVVLIGRQGQDLSKYRVKYTHLGIAFRAAPNQPWRVYELLNECGTGSSELWMDGLANFFLDDPFTLDSIMLVPPPRVAARLAESLRSPALLHGLHEPKYNMVAYPFSTKYQNSNQWVLEVVAAAMSSDVKVQNREQAQSWLKLAGYEPTELHIGPLTRLGGRIVKANIAFDDHPSALRFSDRINAATVDSIAAFLRKRDEGWKIRELRGKR